MEQIRQTGDSLSILAPAKINLSLLIAGKRPDGYHELETVMAKIDYCDEILFEWGTAPGIELICKGSHWAPDGMENLVWKACRLLLDKSGKNIPVKVTLNKNIPAGTGLGSGSSDAASAFLGLNHFANLDFPIQDLHSLAATLGSDINFFLEGPLAFCTGRGEKIYPIPTFLPFQAILVLPDISTSTKRVYENYTHNQEQYNLLSKKVNTFLSEKKVDFAAKMCANMLEESCFRLHPKLLSIKERLEDLTGRKACLSGSGSAIYCLLDKNGIINIEKCRETLKKDFNCECRLVNNNRW